MTPSLLLATVAWAVATRGGTGLRDLLLVLLLLGVAACMSPVRPRRRLTLAVAVTVTALLGWLLLAGPVRSGLTLETVRVPLLVVAVALTALAVRSLDRAQAETFLAGMIVLGCLHAAIALGQLLLAVEQGPSSPVRADSLLGSANGLGMLLVATGVLTVRELDRGGGWLPALALLLQGAALLATGSRTAIALGAALVVVYVVARPGRWTKALAAAGVVVGGAVVVWRSVTEPIEQRPRLWQEALDRIAERPLAGEGPSPAPFTTSSPGARVTTHAHNEVLQWGVEYGLVGIALGVLVVVLLVRAARPVVQGDRWLQVAAVALLAAGLVDFTLRITAVAITAAALTTLAVRQAATRSEPHAGGLDSAPAPSQPPTSGDRA